MSILSQLELEYSAKGEPLPSLEYLTHQSFAEKLGNTHSKKAKIPKSSLDVDYKNFRKKCRKPSPIQHSDSETYDRDDDSDYTR